MSDPQEQEAAAQAEELSEDALDNVSGGGMPLPTGP